MTQSLEFTGERFTPECLREIWYEHMHRYALALELVQGKTVLDAACGEGYGSALLAGRAESVTGVDISEQAVRHASERYSADNLAFRAADCCALPFDDDSFDCVVSFETLEHLENQQQLLSEFRRVLKDDGFLVISSPDKAVYTDQHGNDNEFHVKELYRDELNDLLTGHFPALHWFRQRLMFHSVIWSEKLREGVTYQQLEGNKLTIRPSPEREAMYFIVLCAASEAALPRINRGSWQFDDLEESVYQHYYHEIRKNMSSGMIIKDLQSEIEDLRAQLSQVSARLPDSKPWWRRLLGGA